MSAPATRTRTQQKINFRLATARTCKGLVAARDNNCANVAVVVERSQLRIQLCHQAVAQRIQRFWPIQRAVCNNKAKNQTSSEHYCDFAPSFDLQILQC